MGRSAFTVPADQARSRLDHFLVRKLPDLTRSRIKNLIEAGLVLVDGEPTKAGAILPAGAVVWVDVPPPSIPEARPQAIPLKVLFEDADLIVIDKPPDMVVHPAHGHAEGTLVNALLAHCRDLSGIGGVARPGIVHRLDKGTSGTMVAAKNDAAHASLASQFARHTIERVYLAAVRGTPHPAAGTVDRPLGRHPRERKKIAILPRGRDAVTAYLTAASRGGISLVEVRPATGRTHQIRVHLSSIGHPILGDPAYGGGVKTVQGREAATALRGLGRPALHAWILGFDHPATGLRMVFAAPPADDIAPLFAWIREGRG